MTIHFVSQTEITPDKYIYWSNHPIGKNARKKLFQWKLINIAMMCFSLANGALSLWMGSKDFAMLFSVLFFVFGFKLFFQRNIQNKKLYRQTVLAQGGSWQRTITFASNIQVADNNTVTTFRYSDFKKLSEDKTHYLLYRDENFVLRVEKGTFVSGDEADFLPFIRSRIKDKM